MYKQSLSRGHRSKGIKGKHILQFCVLLAVSFWLIYQIKHSHDKSMEVKDGKILEEIKTDGGIQRLGRKDLPSVIATDDEHEEDNEPGEEKSKHSEDTPEREESNVSRVDGDSELNEKEAEPEEEQVDEVKEREDSEGESEENHTKNEENEGASKENHNANEERRGGSEENRAENEENEGDSEESNTENEEHEGGFEENPAENEENEGESEESNTENEEHEGGSEENHTENEEDENAGKEDHIESQENEGDGKGGHNQSDNTSVDQDQEHDGGNTSTTHEAQEELYKADDASSEVAHNVLPIIPETAKVTTGHENGLLGNIDFGHANETRTSDKDNAEEMPREDKVSDSGTLSNATVTEEKKYERNSAESESENSSLQNSTLPSLPKDQPENNSNLTTVDGGHPATLLSDETQIAASSNKTENVNAKNGESLSSSNTTSGSSHETNGGDAMSAGKDSSLDQRNESENGGIVASDEITEHQSSDEDTGAHQHDPIDASDTELDMLPEHITEIQNTDDTEAE